MPLHLGITNSSKQDEQRHECDQLDPATCLEFSKKARYLQTFANTTHVTCQIHPATSEPRTTMSGSRYRPGVRDNLTCGPRR